MYLPIHSDFIIHWTGKDIEEDSIKKGKEDWKNHNSSETDDDITKCYLDRLKSILKHGLWMTLDKDDDFVDVKLHINGEDIKSFERPLVSRTCFTELKLSEARAHAEQYGRLGIGFKRYFLFDRKGGPMNYYCRDRRNWIFYPALQNPYMISGVKKYKYPDDAYYSCFLKPMSDLRTTNETIKYNYYDESEWRIIYSEEIGKSFSDLTGYFKKPANWSPDFNDYLEDNKKKGKSIVPDYLIPLNKDGETNSLWFAMIIYPSLCVKVEAERDPEIRDLIEALKPKRKYPTNGNKTESAGYEPNGKPIEICLDDCRNF